MTCTRTQEFLAQQRVETATLVDAKKARLGRRDALELLAGARELYAMRGRKVVHVSLATNRPSDADLLALVLGPTGNLRAPTARIGSTLLVGFEPDTWRSVLEAR